MARQAHYIQLTKGVQYWNEWRNHYPTIRPSLNGLNLSGWNLGGINLKDTDLQGSDLRKTNLQEGNLSWANLQKADLTEADLRGANLSEALLEKAIFVTANLSGACLIGADFEKANLSHADLTRTLASKANFKNALLTGVCLQDWYIDKFTNLNSVVCEYVYFRQNRQERRPDNRQTNFALGEFTNLFHHALEFQNQSINQLFDYSAKIPSFKLQIPKFSHFSIPKSVN